MISGTKEADVRVPSLRSRRRVPIVYKYVPQYPRPFSKGSITSFRIGSEFKRKCPSTLLLHWFVDRRTGLLNRVLDALERCPEFSTSDVFVFSDGPKTGAVAADVEAVRALVRARLISSMKLVESVQNKGLANSIIEGATDLCDRYGRVILIEDDLIVSPAILTWFNNALERYEDDPRVMQISGHMFDVPELADSTTGIFLPLTTSWGWATWKRAWDLFDPEADGWEELQRDRDLRRAFDLNGSRPYSRMLRDQMLG